MSLYPQLETIISLSNDLLNELNTICKKQHFAKGEMILNKGERCSDLYFIEKGIVRGYYFEEDKEISHWFAEENEFATSFYAFISQNPSFEFIQCLEETDLIKIPYASLQGLYKNYPETERVGRILTENYYIKLEERLLNIHFKTAKERYQTLLEKKPSLLQRASLGQIASYLGISQETLSRIRAES
jgi:CRP-like cAMP-binding protein